MEKTDQYPISYAATPNEDGTWFETIVLRFYMEDFNYDDAQTLIDYIGLSTECSDKKLLYRDELLTSLTFRYLNILNEGRLVTNISYDGDEKYEYKN